MSSFIRTFTKHLFDYLLYSRPCAGCLGFSNEQSSPNSPGGRQVKRHLQKGTYVASSILGQEREMWVPREDIKPHLGNSMVREGFQQEVTLELGFKGCVGVHWTGK